jgi:hypothetical protein
METLQNQAKHAIRNNPRLGYPSTTHLDLHIEHRIRVDLQPKRRLDVVCEALLIAPFDHRPLLAECLVLNVFEETLQLGEVLEPDALVKLQRLRDEGTELRVALCSGRRVS